MKLLFTNRSRHLKFDIAHQLFFLMSPCCTFPIKEFLIYYQLNTVIMSHTYHPVITCTHLPTKISINQITYVFSTGRTFGPLLALDKEDIHIYYTHTYLLLGCKASITSNVLFFR